MNTTEIYLMMYPPQVLSTMEHYLSDAEKSANTERTKGWVRHARDCFEFTKYLTHALIAYRSWQASGNDRTWHELKERVEDFDRYRERIINYPKSYTDDWFPAHQHFCNWLTADLKGDPEYYIPWDQRKADVLKQGVRGMAMGFSDSYYHSFVKEPLTLDFNNSPPSNNE